MECKEYAEKARTIFFDPCTLNTFFAPAVLMYHSRILDERLNALAASYAAAFSAYDHYRKRVVWVVTFEERAEKRLKIKQTWKNKNLIKERWRHKRLES